jgi:hypothetical protein
MNEPYPRHLTSADVSELRRGLLHALVLWALIVGSVLGVLYVVGERDERGMRAMEVESIRFEEVLILDREVTAPIPTDPIQSR